MKPAKSIGRMVGVLLIAQMLGGFLVNFALLGPVISTPPGFLVNAAPNSLQISLSVLIGLVTGALSLGIAIAALPLLRRHSSAMALWFVSLATVGLSLAVIENSTVMSLLSLSQAYANASAADANAFEMLRGVVASSRNWAHYTHLLVEGATFLVFYGVLYRYALIPRTLAAFGLIAVALQMTAVAMPLFGYRIVMLMIAPMGLAHLALAIWLTIKGFEERTPARPADTLLEPSARMSNQV